MNFQLTPVAMKSFSILLISQLVVGCAATTKTVPLQFSTTDQALSTLVGAAKADDSKQLASIFGPDADEIYRSGDPVADKNTLEKFVVLYGQRHKLEEQKDGSRTLLLGELDWPFPVPLVKSENGKWFFDGTAGVDEVINRRVGRNELLAIQACEAVVDAQREYYRLDPNKDKVREYARRVISSPGTKDGLFWPRQPGETLSPLGPLVAAATGEGYGQNAKAGQRPFHGYFFRVLTEQANPKKSYIAKNGKMTGGFALVAYPARYGVSGIMTFLTDKSGTLYQKDLGEQTETLAKSMTAYDVNSEWAAVDLGPKEIGAVTAQGNSTPKTNAQLKTTTN